MTQLHADKQRLTLLLCFFAPLIFSTSLSAQYKYDYQWPYAEEDTKSNPYSTILDFNHQKVTHYTTSLKSTLWWCRAAICDPNTGRLLYYSNGCDIRDSSTHIMQNGNYLNPGKLRDIYCAPPDGSYLGGPMLFLPFENNPERYMLIHKTGYRTKITPYLEFYRLNYSLIDTKGNQGLGTVIRKNVEIYYDTINSLVSDKMAAVKHNNLKDWWVVCPLDDFIQGFLVLLVSDTGLVKKEIQKIGPAYTSERGGWATFTPDGKKLILFNPEEDISIRDFDRSTGQLSNYVHISIPVEEKDTLTVFGGCAVSGSGRYLYVNDVIHVWQFDLQAEDISASRVLVAEWDRFRDDRDAPVSFLYQERGPDCRIYISPASSSRYSSVILYPDRKGKACMVRQHAIAFEFPKSHGQFAFPNYRLGVAPTCDSTIGISLVATRHPAIHPLFALASPNPLQETLYIDLTGEALYPVKMEIRSITGTSILRTDIRRENSQYDTSFWPEGLYILTLQDAAGRNFVTKIMKGG